MNLSYFLNLKSLEELTAYLNDVYIAAISKLNNGSKRILIVLPTGAGKTTMLLRIAKEITPEQGEGAFFITGFVLQTKQMQMKLDKELPNAKAITFYELQRDSFEQLKDSKYLFVDDLFFRDRRELMRVLKDYQGIVVAMSGTGDQEVMGR